MQKDYVLADSDKSRLFIDSLFADKRGSTGKRVLLFFAYASLLLLFCTKNSPLYVVNDWVDPNVYMNVGRAVSKGAVLYRDVFDQKGPLFLLVFSLLARLSPSMLGLFALQCVTLTASLEILCRTAKMFVPGSVSFKISLIFPVFLLNYLTYYQGGGSVEELMLPMFLGGMYFLLKYFAGRTDAGDVRNSLSPASFMALGIFSGVAVFSKITFSLYFLICAVMIFLHMLLSKKWSSLRRAILLYAAGIFLTALPCLIYFFVTRSFADAWDAYIIFNMKYAAGRQAISTLIDTVITLSVLNIFSVLLIVCGVASFFAGGFRLTTFGKAAASVSMLMLTIMVLIPCRPFNYVFIPLLAFAGIGEIGLCLLIRKYREHQKRSGTVNTIRIAVPAAVVISLFFTMVVASNGLLPESRIFRKEVTGIEAIAETIRVTWDQEGTSGEPSLLIYNAYDVGLYDLAETCPKLKYFQLWTVSGTMSEEMITEQEQYIDEGLPDYVVTIGYNGESDPGRVDVINPAYEIIDSEAADSQRNDIRITLYMKK